MQIPLRTLEEWEAGRRLMPDYVLRLIVYYTSMEQRLKEKGIELFGRDQSVISRHIRNVFKEQEVDEKRGCYFATAPF